MLSSSNASSDLQPKSSSAFEALGHGLEDSLLDPVVEADAWPSKPTDPMVLSICERDFSLPCPLLFLPVLDFVGYSNFDQDAAQPVGRASQPPVRCAASTVYRGPCAPIIKLQDDDSASKVGIMTRCGVRWPCRRCAARDYAKCPHYFAYDVSADGCAPTPNYTGPCADFPVSFKMHNADMLDIWAALCSSFFLCKL